ncbi:MAG: peptidase C13 [Gammaproteobacteria bacterium]|nr:peptidase C13 [Gammaproteobacteria bacterium]NIN62356.1 peptidase C13 [Gammaproteobacteria bacterium]NIO61410.1 peptidase C13 [Gammaproteobacteria bacterium]NIP49875.1 peptidase C13 [Gammaproteobacteria bacterium]NIQ11908.1 peptidase C13 [Gammaproteobacteria bacterium]
MKTLVAFIVGSITGTIILATLLHLNFQLPQPVAIVPDGAIYDGEMQHGVIHGQGRMRWPNGDIYQGEFENGLFHGQGRYESSNGVVYSGQFANGRFTGMGTIRYSGDRYYQGEVKDWEQHGHGTYVDADMEYTGDFVEGRFEGTGTFQMANGDVYSGQFKKGELDGQGTYTSIDYRHYEGKFVKGQFTGMGKYADGTGLKYEGMFDNWVFHGEGKLTQANGDQYLGYFVQGSLHGEGEFIGKDGSHYVGDFEHGSYHGRGRLMTARGDHYVGRFHYGQYHGRGILTYAEPVDGTKVIRGRWQNGKLVEANNMDLVVDTEANNELVLYNQSALLETHWNQIEENDPGVIDLYFLGIAGDGTESVFRREVLYIRDYFDNTLDTEGKSMALVNNVKTVTDYPLATQTSIRQTLERISQKMDPDNDILFLYLSSHGTDDFKFSLKQEELPLPDLPVQELAAMLEALPIQWKVIVVSACYSGGYIPHLKNNQTLIITAAASDKTSFGCEDRNEFTYFGEAYFKDALPDTQNFLAAFDRAVEILRAREEAEDFEHSNPQIHKPQAILDHLQAWRASVQIASGEITRRQ